MENNIDGRKLTIVRERKLLSRNELAQRADLAISAIQRIEQSGETVVRGKTLRKLAHGFGMKPEELVGLVGVNEGVLLVVDTDTYARLKYVAEKRSVTVEEYLVSHAKARTRNTKLIVPSSQSPGHSTRTQSSPAAVDA